MRKLVFFVVVATLVASVVACSAPEPTPPPVSKTTREQPPVSQPVGEPSSAPKPTAQPSPVRKPSGEMKIAITEFGNETLDPSLNSVGSFKPIAQLMHDFFIGATPDGKLSKETGLAQDWDIKHSKDNSVYTFYLRPGVKFHDGVEVTAQDVEFSLKYYMRPKSVTGGVAELREFVDRIETPERYKVVVYTKKPYGLLHSFVLSRLGLGTSFILPKQYIEKNGEEYFNKHPIGTGPYKFKEQVVGSHVTFEAWDQEHWLYGVPRYEKVTAFIVPEESTVMAMLQTGEIDMAPISLERIKELEGKFNIAVKKGATIAWFWLGNTYSAGSYLNDVRVREALNVSIDRAAIIQNIFAGRGTPMEYPWLTSSALGYEPYGPFSYDPEKAKRLIQEAMRDKGWDKVKLKVYSFPRAGVDLPRMTEAVAGMWKKVGIEVDIVPSDYGLVRDLRMTEGKLVDQILNMAMEGDRPLWPLTTNYHSKGRSPIVKDPQLDVLIEAMEAAVDMNDFGKAQLKASKYMREQYHGSIPIAEIDTAYAIGPKMPKWDLGKVSFGFFITTPATQGKTR